MKAKIKIGIVGASGYSGEELVRLLLAHPNTELVCVTSRQFAGQTLAQVFPRFASHPVARSLKFNEPTIENIVGPMPARGAPPNRAVDVVFLALPHGVAAEYAAPLLDKGLRLIDLSADFRLKDAEAYRDFYGHEHPAPALLKLSVYGLPEIYREKIRESRFVASPGCYPTSILLPIIPLLREGLIQPAGIIADSLSGVSGAGRKAENDYLFVECNESVRAYAVPKHRHLCEIEQELSNAAKTRVTISFTPHLVPINRGILSTLYLKPARQTTGQNAAVFDVAVRNCYGKAYGAEPFVRLLEGKQLPDTKHVQQTNCIEIGWRVDPRTGRLIVISAIDNLTKGAAGQAVQAMNLMFGLDETLGLVQP
jgi:N-acetyl-gamma-glutamyl-phosphate reductase